MKDFRKAALSRMAVLAVLVVSGGCNYIKIVETGEGFLVAEGRQKILFYQRKLKSLDAKFTRANYVHPLYSLDGQILTEDFPADHPHHRGIFWAWHQIYVGDKKLGDGWSSKDISWDVYDAKVLTVDSQSRALQVGVYWKSPLWTDAGGKQKPFVEETTAITVHRAESDFRRIDFEISLLALEDGVRIGGADNEKAYGGFSTRIRLPEGIEFTAPKGPVEPQGTPIEAGPWLDFSGGFADDGEVSGLVILCHKSNPGYPHKWILRRKRSMQNPVWPGRYPVALSREKPLILRYRLIIHRGNAHNINLSKLQVEYNAELQQSSG
jgi:hypothetical protein